MQAKLTYQQQYGMKQFLVLLKKHGLHAGRGNRLLIVHELLNVLHNDATRERLTQDDAKDEVPQVLLKTKQEQVSKRKRTEPWLAEIVKQISFPLHKRLCKYLPKEIVAQTIAKWILQDVSILLKYSSHYSTIPHNTQFLKYLLFLTLLMYDSTIPHV